MAADKYTHGHHESVLRSHAARTAENSAGYLLPHLRPGQQLLDVGCGPATITADLAELVSPGSVVAIDNADAIIETAQATLDQRQITNAVVRNEDVYSLPFADDTFDVVHAHQVLQHLTNPVGALMEMRRVCRPGGLIAVRDSDYPAMTWYPQSPAMDRWMEIYLQIARGNGAEPAAGRRLLGWAHAAGLSDVTPSASAWCFATPQRREWWGSLWAERVVSSAFAEQAVSLGFADEHELHRIAEGWRAWAQDADGWYVVTLAEILCKV